MKVLPLVVHKLWPRLKFLSTDDADKNNDDDDNNAGAMTIVLRTSRHGELKTIRVFIFVLEIKKRKRKNESFFLYPIKFSWCKIE